MPALPMFHADQPVANCARQCGAFPIPFPAQDVGMERQNAPGTGSCRPALSLRGNGNSPPHFKTHDFSLIFLSQSGDWPPPGNNLLKEKTFRAAQRQ
jgi:hypothetical protein